MTKIKTILTCVLIAVLSGCGKSSPASPASPAAPPSAEIDLKEALRSSIFEQRGETFYKIHIDSDGMKRISGRIVSNEELKTLKQNEQNEYEPTIGIYLAVYEDQDSDIVNGVFESLQNCGIRTIESHVSDQESEIMQKSE